MDFDRNAKDARIYTAAQEQAAGGQYDPSCCKTATQPVQPSMRELLTRRRTELEQARAEAEQKLQIVNIVFDALFR